MSVQILNLEDWSEKLIKAVKERPAIYDKKLKEHSNRKVVLSNWNAVCKAVWDGWSFLSQAEKDLKRKDIQSKWRNLKTTFQREVNIMKGKKCGQAAKKRRKYIYFDQLAFLLPNLDEKSTESRQINAVESEDFDTCSYENSHASTDFEMDYKQHPSELITSVQNETNCNDKSNKIFKGKEAQHVEEEIDEDKYFLLSLVPSFKKMTYIQKLEVKMDFLASIKRITQPSIQ